MVILTSLILGSVVAIADESGSRVLFKWYCTEGLFCGENNVSPLREHTLKVEYFDPLGENTFNQL